MSNTRLFLHGNALRAAKIGSPQEILRTMSRGDGANTGNPLAIHAEEWVRLEIKQII
jgi:hypothetical protein